MSNEEMILRSKNESALKSWREQEKKAIELLTLVGELRFDRSIELVLFRNDIYDSRPSEVLNYHQDGENYSDKAIDIDLTLQITRSIHGLTDLAPSKIDIGKLALEWQNASMAGMEAIDQFIHDKLGDFIGKDKTYLQPKDVVLYGFGRIGRLLARRIIALTGQGQQLRLKAIVLRAKMEDQQAEMEKRAALLMSDSVHGDFHGTVSVSDDATQLIVNGNRIHVIFANDPSEVDYEKYGIENALLIDNTGVWRDKNGLSQHLRPGIDKVLLTAPGKDIPNIVHGVNQTDSNNGNHDLMSAASCTTNAIVPIIKVIDEEYGIERGHIETIHAYTSDQNLLDNFHKKPRRGRGAAINMVLTTTGAAKAVAKVLPHLKGKLTGNAVRVPTPDVSLAIMSLTVEKPTSVDDLNNFLRKKSLQGNLVEQIHYSTSTEYVSSNAVGMTSTSVLDAPSTIVSSDGKNMTIYAWYDNEFGYVCQVVRLAKHIARVRRYNYY